MSLAARMARAKAMGYTTDVYHYSHSADPFDAFAVKTAGRRSSFLDGLGIHVGTKQAALDRFSQYTDGVEPSGFTMPLKAKLESPYVRMSDGTPYTESQLRYRLKEIARKGGIDPDRRPRDAQLFVAEKLKKEGYDHIPYVNSVEDKGNISYVVLDPSNLRSQSAAFDPAKASSSDLLASLGPYAAAGGLGLLALGAPGESRAAKLSREMTHTKPSQPVDRLGRLQAGMQAGATANVPIASDLMGLLGDALMYYREPHSRTWPNYLGTAAGLLPFVP